MTEEKKVMSEETSGIVEHFWEKPENILRLIDLIFLCDEGRDLPPS